MPVVTVQVDGSSANTTVNVAIAQPAVVTAATATPSTIAPSGWCRIVPTITNPSSETLAYTVDQTQIGVSGQVVATLSPASAGTCYVSAVGTDFIFVAGTTGGTATITISLDGSSALATITVTQVSGAIVWKADGSLPISQEWAEYSTPTNCTTYTNSVGVDPNAFFQTTIKPPGSLPGAYEFVADTSSAGGCYGHRAEVGQGLPERPGFSESRRFLEGDDRWFSWQLLLGADYPVNNNNWNLLNQWKGNANSNPLNSISATQILNGGLIVTIPAMFGPPIPVTTGRWLKFTVHFLFSSNSSLGFVEAWGDNGDGAGMRQFTPRMRGYTLVTDANGTVPAHSRVGIYRNGVIPGPAHMWVAGYTVATTRAAAEANAFR